MRDHIKMEKKSITDGLQVLGFTANDAKVYCALMKLGISNPAKIADESGVDRARVYDSLKRLTKKNIIEEESVKRAPNYKAKSPNFVFERIRKELNDKIKLSKIIEEDLTKLQNPVNESSVWAVNGEQKNLRSINQLIDSAKESLLMIITPDISSNQNLLPKIAEKIINKKKRNLDLEIRIAFYIEESHIQLIKKLVDIGIEVYKWNSSKILPFGMYISEKSFILTILCGVSGLPEYSFGITVENPTSEMLTGSKHMVDWCYANVCKKATLIKQKK